LSSESVLRDKLRKIEALFAGAKTEGERTAAGAAADRIRQRLAEFEAAEAAIEMRFSLPDPWSRQLFLALARRYGLRPYRYPRMQRQSVIIRAPKSFIDGVLWPEFQAANAALTTFLGDVTSRVISEEVHGGGADAEVVPEPKAISDQ
jgi:hypothetical protein